MKNPILVGLLGAATASAFGQNAAADSGSVTNQLQEVVVTGTLIRGVAPAGAPLTTLSNAQIVASGTTNTADLLATAPGLNSFNTLPIGGNQQYRSTGATVPGMRGLPGTAVLVLLDGHRMVGDSPLLSTPDPSSIPAGAIDHIEILQDGGSATYGSDAVAGVINIITRKNFDGAETTGSYTGADGYNGSSLGQTFGKTWTGGSAMVSGQFENNSDLLDSDRSYYEQDLRRYGGRDNLSTICGPAKNFSINGTYYNATTLTQEPGSAVTQQSTCDPYANADLVNPNRRYSIVGNVRQDVGSRVHLSFDAKWTDDLSHQTYAPTNLVVNLPGLPGGLIIPSTNPFYLAPPGNTSGAPESVEANSLALGPIGNVTNVYRARSGMADLGARVDLTGSWELNTDFDYGNSTSSALNPDSTGPNPDALYAAENGTTTSTALDPFGGRTSPQVAQAIMDWPLLFKATQRLYDLNVTTDGTLYNLPGGPVKLAVGVANRHEEYSGEDPIGVPGDLGFTQPNYQHGSRVVNAGFAQLSLPIFGERNALPGLQSLRVSLAGRYDHYSDFGGTTNPKYGIEWAPIRDLTLRSSYGTSFHAPQLADTNAIDTRAGYSQSTTTSVLPPGMPVGVYTIGIAGGKPNLLPETATTTTFGFDFTPEALRGFKASLTYFMIRYDNEVEIPPNSSNNFAIPSLTSELYHYNETAPGVYAPIPIAELASILSGVRTTFPGGVAGLPPIYLVSDLRRTNVGTTDIDGWDFDFDYHKPLPLGMLSLSLTGEYFVMFKTRLAPGTSFIDNLTSGLQYFQNDAGAQSIIPWHWRAAASWQVGPYATQLAVNYTGHYDYGYTAYNYASNPAGTPSNAIQWVQQFVTVDWSGIWNLPDGAGPLKNTRLQLNVYNILNQAPPLQIVYGASGGFASESANPLGRTVRISLDKLW